MKLLLILEISLLQGLENLCFFFNNTWQAGFYIFFLILKYLYILK